MSTTTPFESTMGIIRNLLPPSWQGRNVLAALLFVTATLNSIWLFQVQPDWPSVIATPDFTIIAEPNTWIAGTKLRIGVALVIAAIAFFFSRGKALIISALALAWLLIEYALWLYRSSLISRNEGITYGSLAHLIDGSWWDAWVILFAIVLLAYTVTAILRKYCASSKE